MKLGDASALPPEVYPEWRPLMCDALTAPVTGGKPQPSISGTWRVNLLNEVRKRLPGVSSYTLEALLLPHHRHPHGPARALYNRFGIHTRLFRKTGELLEPCPENAFHTQYIVAV